MTDLTPLLSFGSIGTLVAVAVILIRLGVMKISFGKNGNGNGHEIKEKLDEIEGNHLHTIETKIDDLKQGQEKTNEFLLEAVLILRDIKTKI